jgi:DeoR family transcriptional regulator, fructose operon transcriptional repressor
MNERFEKIKAILLKEKKIDVIDLSERLAVSEVTIRKDLTFLEQQGFLLRRYGGAILAENPGNVIEYIKKIRVQEDEKLAIAKFAASMVDDGENLLLDAGSTAFALACELRGRNLRIVTNNIAIAYELMKDSAVTVELLGGTLRKASGALIGPWVLDTLDVVRVDKVFMGVSGFDPKRGFSSENAVEAEVKRKMLSCGGEVIILADATKFARPAFANFAKLDEVDMLVTDKKVTEPAVSALKKAKVKVKVAKN